MDALISIGGFEAHTQSHSATGTLGERIAIHPNDPERFIFYNPQSCDFLQLHKMHLMVLAELHNVSVRTIEVAERMGVR